MGMQTGQSESLTLGDYEIHIAREGFASIRHVASQEIMHSRTPPMEEARNLYVEQSRLSRHLRSEEESDIVIWDVGLGAAANAMAAIECYEAQTNPVRGLQIISFENDLDSLRLALRHSEKFPYLKHSAPRAILENATWQSERHPKLKWLLIPGSYPQTIGAAPLPPDIIFYDMFSNKSFSEPWGCHAFRELYTVCRGRSVQLFTYTCSTAARVAMLSAGFHLAKGRNAGEKLETTIAFTPEAYRQASFPHQNILAEEWLGKWKRSTARFPADIPVAEYPVFEKIILDHPQFREL
ncbi:MAG: MnmC family methyltransferase [Chthoniobacterales bacterium]